MPTQVVYFSLETRLILIFDGGALVFSGDTWFCAWDPMQEVGVIVTASSRGTYRNTTQRAIILAEVEQAEGHLTAGEIFERVRRRYPTIAYGTVYRTLHLLAEHELIQELTFADQASRFDKRTDRHDHVHCTECGVLMDVDVPVALLADRVAEEQTGFEVHRHHTVFEGICPMCLAARDITRVSSGEAKTAGLR
jgi:Fe2+ or Zn2+ uptake regulation protein